MVLINTVEYNKIKYSNSDLLRSVQACKMQKIIGNPSYCHYKKLVSKNELKNFPVNTADIDAVGEILGLAHNVSKVRQAAKK